MKSCSGNFLNFTNSHLESINRKLKKQVINQHSSSEDFVENFLIILTALRTEHDHKAAIKCQKIIRFMMIALNSCIHDYLQFMLPNLCIKNSNWLKRYQI